MKNKDLSILVKGSAIIFINTIILYIIRFVYKILLSRNFGPSDFGKISLALMIINIAVLFSNLGLSNGIIKYISHFQSLNNFSKLIGTIKISFLITFLFSIIVTSILLLSRNVLLEHLFHETLFKNALTIFLFCIPFLALTKLSEKAFIGFRRPIFNIISGTISKDIPLLIGAIIIILTSKNLFSLSLVYLFVYSFCLLISIYLLFKYFLKKFNHIKKVEYPTKEILYYSFPLFLSTTFLTIMGWADSFFLGIFFDPSEVGIYNIAISLATCINIFLTSFSGMIFPTVSAMAANNKLEEIKKIIQLVSHWGLILSLPFALLLIIFPKQIISFFFGEIYVLGWFPLIILTVGYFTNVIVGPLTETLQAFNKVKNVFKTNIFATILNLILNIILIPKYSIIGAAIATTSSLIIRELSFLYQVKKLIPIKFQIKKFINHLAYSIVPLLVFIPLKLFFNINNPFSLFIFSVTYLIIYFILILKVNKITKEELEIIESIEKKIGRKIPLIRIIRKK